MKKISLVAAIILAMSLFQGCSFPQPYPIENTQNILIAGIDTNGDEIVLTVLTDSINQSGENGEEQIEHVLYSATGKTVFEAKRNLHKYTEKRVSFYHMSYILLGEQAAKFGVDKLLKFFCENDENNLLHKLIIAKGITAKEFLEQQNAGDKKIPDCLDALFEETGRTGYSQEIRLLDYAQMRETSWRSLYIPTVLLIKDPIKQISENSQNESEQSSSTLTSLEGFGVFDEDKLVGYLDANMARGVSFVVNELDSTAISVQDNKGLNVALEVMQSKAKIEPKFEDPLSATIQITVNSNMVEYQESDDVLDGVYIEFLEQQQSAFIKNEIEQTLSFLQKKQTDVVDMGDAFYHKNPNKWQAIKDEWNSRFSDLKIKVDVNSNIQCTYVITNALGD